MHLYRLKQILHRTEKIYTGTACGACDKYEVCPPVWQKTRLFPDFFFGILPLVEDCS